VRGALENFTHLGQVPELLRQADSEEAAGEFPDDSFDALVTDPPYGRASGTRGEAPTRLWDRALSAWARRVRPGGRLGIVVPEGAGVPRLEARLERVVPQRVHRSLTREFRVYVRDGAGRPAQ
jgi:tRNA G10  N-methylase Trm11